MRRLIISISLVLIVPLLAGDDTDTPSPVAHTQLPPFNIKPLDSLNANNSHHQHLSNLNLSLTGSHLDILAATPLPSPSSHAQTTKHIPPQYTLRGAKDTPPSWTRSLGQNYKITVDRKSVV